MALYIDAKSVYAAVIATNARPPSDKSLLCHVQRLRALLDRGSMRAIVWVDTRDMTADGLTKGAVQRDSLHTLMYGCVALQHPAEVWVPRNTPQLFMFHAISEPSSMFPYANSGQIPNLSPKCTCSSCNVLHDGASMRAPWRASPRQHDSDPNLSVVSDASIDPQDELADNHTSSGAFWSRSYCTAGACVDVGSMSSAVCVRVTDGLYSDSRFDARKLRGT